jgi:TonB family protein
MTAANVLAYAAQVTIVVIVCAGLPRLLRLRSPAVQYAFWRMVLLVCLLLPIVQPWQPAAMAFVPAPGPPPQAVDTPVPPPAPAPRQAASTIDWRSVAQIAAAAGISVRLAWLALGAIRLRRLRRHATDAAIGFDDLKSAIGAAPPILWSPDVRHPVTFGVFDPVILLPAAVKAIDLPAQRAIVAHELHHVRRRDWCWVIAEEIVRSALWFHPAMWWLISRVQLARETVVDELSILATNARRTYLDTLLAFADDTGLASSPAFSARRHLFHRVMLLSKEGGMSSIRIAAIACVLLAALAAGSWGAVSAFPLSAGFEEPAFAEAAAATSQAPPRDPAIADGHVKIALEYWEKVFKDTSLMREEKLSNVSKSLASLDRALAINPNHASALMWKNVLLRMRAVLTEDTTEPHNLLQLLTQLRTRAMARTSQTVEAHVPAPGPEGFTQLVEQHKPVRIGRDVRMPAKIRDVRPVYPPIAQAARVQGVVIVEVLVDRAGLVTDARVLRSIPLLDAAALDAVRQWVFQPTHVNGEPRAAVMTLTVNFVLD